MNKLLLPVVFAFALLMFSPITAHASLLGDSVHVRAGIDGTICEEDVIVMDPGIEIPACAEAFIDLNANSIWFVLQNIPNGVSINPIFLDFTGLDWTDDPNGILVDVIVTQSDFTFQETVTFDAHSISIQIPATPFPPGHQCPSAQSSCDIGFHLDLVHSSSSGVGGEIIPINTASLLLAGVQTSALWLIPFLVSAAGITIFFARKKIIS